MVSNNLAANDHTIKLKDGRRLGFAEYGDPEGKPLFFFHGWPSSRLHGKNFDEAAEKLKIRIISTDRPGYGLSDFKPNRTLLDWPDDVIELAEKLKINKFVIVGISGGGPYAAACAYKIPKKITKAGIVVGLAPLNIKGNLDGMFWINRMGWANFHKFPILTEISSFLGLLETKLLPINVSSLFLVSKPDKLMSTKSFRKTMHQSRREAFRQGIKATAQDLKIYSNNWGFNIKNIKIPVHLWYGGADKTVSLKMGNYYASQIPNSKLKVYPNEGHYCQITHAEEILKLLFYRQS